VPTLAPIVRTASSITGVIKGLTIKYKDQSDGGHFTERPRTLSRISRVTTGIMSNAITVLVRDQNNQDASRMLELLSGVLRQVLQSRKREEVTLDMELQFIKKYLAIEEVRFSDRLQIDWSIDAALLDALVPEFILQPLVENAVRHGIGKLSDTGVIEIKAASVEGELLLSVIDNGPGCVAAPEGGLGLTNTRARLETLFGEAAELNVSNANGCGTVATVRFPLRREVDA